MSDKKELESTQEKKSVDPWYWVIGIELVLVLIGLVFASLGYTVLK